VVSSGPGRGHVNHFDRGRGSDRGQNGRRDRGPGSDEIHIRTTPWSNLEHRPVDPMFSAFFDAIFFSAPRSLFYLVNI